MKSSTEVAGKLVRWGLISITACGLVLSYHWAARLTQTRAAGKHSIASNLHPHNERRLASNYGNIPLHFEANQGQADAQVKFLTRGSGYSMFLTPTETVLSLTSSRIEDSGRQRDPSGSKIAGHSRAKGSILDPQFSILNPFSARNPFSAFSASSAVNEPLPARHSTSVTRHSTVRMKLLHANPSPKMAGIDELPGKVNYFIGNDPEKWRSNVATYAKVKYESVYPGVDLIHYGNQQQLEYDFVVAPGADPKRIALAFDGAERLELNTHGDLVLHTAAGDLTQHKPIVYQEVDGERKEVEGRYLLLSTQDSALSTVSFEVGDYDHDRPLVIDPVLSYSTLLGGSVHELGMSIAVDAAGNAYVMGVTGSANFPKTAGAFRTAYPGGNNAFVTKLNPVGSALVYSTYLGESADNRRSFFDLDAGIAVDAAGNAYVTGTAYGADFPTTAGAFQTTFGGNLDAFVTKLNPAGSGLVYSTFLGGSNHDLGLSIAVDAAGNAYVSGWTHSTNFPTTAGAFQTTFGGGDHDAFVTKLNPAGSGLVYSTYLGGNRPDLSSGIAVDAAGNAYVTGYTLPNETFPTTAGAFQTTGYSSNVNDAFVTKLNPAGSALVYSTLLGARSYCVGIAIAVDAGGNAYVTGYIRPYFGSVYFPTTSGAFQTTHGGGTPPDAFVTNEGYSDAFVTKLNPAGSALVYSTYLGGSSLDVGYGIAVDAGGNAYVTGYTRLYVGSNYFPTTSGAFQLPYGSESDTFVTKLNPAGSALVYSTYLGGSGGDFSGGIAVDAVGNAYVTGATGLSTDFPTTAGSFQTAHNGSHDAFVAKFGDAPLVRQVAIDIKPGSFPNSINLKEKGVLPVAILATRDFDARQVQVSSVRLGDPRLRKAEVSRSAEQDVDGDGDIDLMLFFRVPEMVINGAIDSRSTELELTGNTFAGIPIVGRDSVRVVPPG